MKSKGVQTVTKNIYLCKEEYVKVIFITYNYLQSAAKSYVKIIWNAYAMR